MDSEYRSTENVESVETLKQLWDLFQSRTRVSSLDVVQTLAHSMQIRQF